MRRCFRVDLHGVERHFGNRLVERELAKQRRFEHQFFRHRVFGRRRDHFDRRRRLGWSLDLHCCHRNGRFHAEFAAVQHALGAGHEGVAGAQRATAGGQFVDPCGHVGAGPAKQRQQARCCGTAFGDPQVHDFFNQGRALAEVIQADHAATALERVERSAHNGHGLLARRFVLQFRQGGGNQLQYFLRFHDEDFEQFGFDFALHRHRWGGRDRWRGDSRILGERRWLRYRGRYDGQRCMLRRRRRRCFLDHDWFRLECGLARRLLERHLAQHAFGAVKGEPILGGVEILGQHIDEKAQRTDVLGDVLQRRRFELRIAFGGGQRAHCFLHVQRGAHGVFLIQDRDRALQLVQHRIDLTQGWTLGAVRIVIVEHLFNLAQAVFHLGGEHRDSLVLLDPARQVALPLRSDGRRLPGGQRQQALANKDGVCIKVVGQLANLVQAVLDKQHGAGHLEAEHVVATRGDRIFGRLDKLVLQPCQRRGAQLVAGRGDGGELLFEFGFLGGIDFGSQLVPGDLGPRECFLGRLERVGIDAAVALLVVIGRHHVVDAIGAAQGPGCR